jgi:hypothetical protein
MTSANHFVPQAKICNDGFTRVVKKTRNKPGNIRNLPKSGLHRSRPAMVGVRNSTSLLVITQKPKLRSHFILRLGPDVLASDITDFLHGYSTLTSHSCIILNTKFSSYSYFLVSVTEDYLPRVNDGAAWSNG